MRRRKGDGGSTSHYLLSLDAPVKDPWQGLTRAFRALIKE
jgi:hypothetical protein